MFHSPRALNAIALRPKPEKEPARAKLHGIKADLLIPGRGEPLKKAVVVIHENQITWVGLQSSIPAKYSAIPYTNVPVLLPGLWDCHVHFYGAGDEDQGGYAGAVSTPAVLAAARITVDFKRTLMAGFTSVREVGGYGGEMSPAVNEGTIVGPNIYSSIAAIAITGGHGDIHNLPLQTVHDASAHGLPFAVCDGVPDCILTVRKMIRRGAKCIKVCASGGVFSIQDGVQETQFSPEELKAMVQEAARAKRSVAAHCHGKEGIINALNAGVKSIEHGSFFDEECAALMKEKGAILVPTAIVIEEFMKYLDELPGPQRRKLLEVSGPARKAYAIAIKSGVKIALGTDSADSSGLTFNSHGRNGKEMFYAVKAGMTPLQAIEACTATSPETLGLMAPKSGQLKAGYDADLIALSENPLDNIDLLSKAENITHVWKGGKLFKSP
jgi:imidazolonepropionase-like amidohydrolase